MTSWHRPEAADRNDDSPSPIPPTLSHRMTASTEVFNIPELLEVILLSLPGSNIHQELSSMRTIILGQGTCRTWHALVQRSTPIRKRLYYTTPSDAEKAKEWLQARPFPPQPNPWIPYLLLNRRSWGLSWPFENHDPSSDLQPSHPKFWTFCFELSRPQYSRLPKPGLWRNMLVASPSFTDFWYTRCFYELGSSRAPIPIWLDYDAKLLKSRQKYTVHCHSGITLGHVCDAMAELFDRHPAAKLVTLESIRV